VHTPHTLVADTDVNDRFYDDLRATLRRVPQSDKLFVLGDFNARVSTDDRTWGDIIGKHGVGNFNSNGLRLLNTCSEFDLLVTNTLFQQRDQLKTTWQHPRSKHWHMLDYVMVHRRDRQDVLLARAMRGAECWTDHKMVRALVRLQIRPPVHKRKPRKRLIVRACSLSATQAELQEAIQEKLSSIPDHDTSSTQTLTTLTAEWQAFSNCILEASIETLGYTHRKHQDWFDDSNVAI